MMSTLLPLAGYLLYIVCMATLSNLLLYAMCTAFPSLPKGGLFVVSIAIFLPLALKNFLWLVLISEFPSTLPSSVSALLDLAAYLVCMTGLSSLVLAIALFVCEAAPRMHHEEVPDWIFRISFGVTVVVMDMFMKHSGHSNMMATLRFVGYLVYIMCMIGLSYLVFEILVFDDIIVPVLPSLLRVPLNYQKSAPIIVAGVILVLTDMHGVTPVEKPCFIYEFFSTLPSSVSGTLPGYHIYMACMVALSFLLLIIATGAILQTRIRCPMERPELILSTIVGLTFMLLNTMWGTPFEKPSSDSGMKAALPGLAVYLVYVLCSMALSHILSKSMMHALVISLTFVLLHMFSVSDMIDTLVVLVSMFAKALLTLFFLVPLLLVVCLGLYTWVLILLPSSGSNYNELTFASVINFFKVMQAMLDTPALLSTTDLVIRSINNYETAYKVISYIAVFLCTEITRKISNVH